MEKCKNCGSTLADGDEFCRQCGQLVERIDPAPVAVPVSAEMPVSNPGIMPPTAMAPASVPEKTFGNSAIWATILAVFAPIVAWNWYAALGVGLCVASVIIAVRSKKGLAIAASVISAAVIVFMFAITYL